MGIDLFVNPNSSIEAFIETTLRLEARPRFALLDRKELFTNRGKALTDLESKLSKLHSLAKRLTDPITDHFSAKSAAASDADKFTATADSGALVGNHDVEIVRLATSDTRVSQQYTSTSTDLRSFFDTNGSQTFQIDVGHPITGDSSNRVSISVTVNPVGVDNDSIMDAIALAVNDAMSAAVTAGTIKADEKASASVVHETGGTSRMIFKSAKSGFANRLTFTDSANSLLSTTQISTNAATSGTSGGYVTTVGTSASDSQLNSELKVDGLTFYRDGNSINDILDDVTLTLKDVTTTTESLEIKVDTEKVKAELEDIIGAYNDVISFIRSQTGVDADTNTRGALAGDSTYRGLRSTLRNVFTGLISSVASGNPGSVFDIGITSSNDGTLSISDTAEFEAALTDGADRVSDVFNSSNGIATQLKSLLETYVKVGGVIDDSQRSLDDRTRTIDRRVSTFDARLARREVELRDRFARIQGASQAFGAQLSAFNSIFSSFRF